MKALFKLIYWLVLLIPILLIAAVWAALESTAAVARRAELTQQDLVRARDVLASNDPRQMKDGSRQSLTVSTQDLELVANYLLQPIDGAAIVAIAEDLARVTASVRVPGLPVRPFINLSFTLEETDAAPVADQVRIGGLQIPDLMVSWLTRPLLALWQHRAESTLVNDSIERVSFGDGVMTVDYRWNAELIERGRSALLPSSAVDAMNAYHDVLLNQQRTGRARAGSLAETLTPLFAEASRRSVNADPVAENRALLFVLGTWASGRNMDRLISADMRNGTLPGFRLKLAGRGDLAQHFLTSAALAAGGTSALSDAIGVFKEISDADGGSGFSFADLAADKAGTRFGESLTATASSARSLQTRLASGIDEALIMPSIDGLPEPMQQAEFEQRYGGIGGDAYEEVVGDINRRIAGLALYR